MRLSSHILAASAFALLATAACGNVADPRDQWLVVVGTDAPVPQLGDRIRVEVTDANGNACNGCSRELAANDPTKFPLSFGVTREDKYRHLRIRFFRGDHVDSNDAPYPTTTIDFAGVLPAAPSQVDSVSVTLAMACYGIAMDGSTGNACDPASGALAAPKVLGSGAVPSPSSWPLSKDQPCNGTPPDGTVCIPGGLLLMGDDKALLQADKPEHLVRVSAFAIDQNEITVGAARALLAAHHEITARPKARPTVPLAVNDACTYLGDTNAQNDALPLNCVAKALASDLCAALGKRLPTEAEWEMAARNRGSQSRFPWGDVPNDCEHSITGRGRTLLEVSPGPEGDGSCRIASDGSGVPWGPVAGGAALDVTALGVHDMAGNLEEFVADDYAPFTDACWTTTAILQDPQCTTDGALASVRGGGYDATPSLAFSANRNGQPTTIGAVNVGFRCALSMH
jgi:formylglycine-generating enzyme required for sulfatase activity